MTRPRPPLVRPGVVLAVSALAILAAMALQPLLEPLPLGQSWRTLAGVVAGLAMVWLTMAGQRAEKARREADETLHAVIRSSTLGIVMLRPDATVRSWSPTAAQIFGWVEGETIGRPLPVIPPESRAEFRASLDAALRGEVLSREMRLQTKGGELLDVRVSTAPLHDSEGRMTGVVMVVLDITPFILRDAGERARAEEERAQLLTRERAARAEAETAKRARDEFLAMLSHELRSPLNAMAGWARVLEVGHADAATVARAAEAIGRSVRDQAQLVEDLLDVSRIVSGQLRLEWQPVDLARVIGAALSVVRPAAEAKMLRLEATLDPAAATVWGDPERLQQVVGNLLTNAVKFTPNGGRVDVRLERADSRAHIRVIDTGQGIAAEVLPTVFDRFRQADSTPTRRHGGLGLGLAIVRHLVELHGGRVHAESPGPGRGATFTVALPIPAALPPASAVKVGDAGVEPVAAGTRPPRLPGIRVLVVDDDPDARISLARLLEQCGAQVWAAASAIEALAMLDRQVPDALISDIAMPEEDGYTLLRKIRARPAALGGQVPAVALTGYSGAQDVERSRAAGFQRHFAKPARLADLVTSLAVLARRESAGPAIDGPGPAGD